MGVKKNIFHILEVLSLFTSPFIALSTGVMDLLPGALLTLFSIFFSSNTWLLLLYPPLLSFRGTLGGIYSGRMSTSLHLGNMLPSLLKNSEEYYTLLTVISILYMLGGILLVFTVSVLAYFLFGYALEIINYLFLLTFSTFFLTQIVMFPLVTFVAKLSYLKGWDPDIITYPFTSSLGDITITSFFLIVSYLLLHYSYNWFLLVLSGGNLLLPFIFYLGGFNPKLFITEFKESFLAILIVSIIVNITGSLFRELSHYLKRNPLLYFIYPTILTSVGDAGSIIGSISTTKLALLGKIDFDTLFRNDLPIIITLIGIIFPLYGFFGQLLFHLSPNTLFFIKLSISGIISVFIISSLAIFIAFLTYRRGLDPDHFVTPLESTSADSITTFILYILFTLI